MKHKHLVCYEDKMEVKIDDDDHNFGEYATRDPIWLFLFVLTQYCDFGDTLYVYGNRDYNVDCRHPRVERLRSA